MQSGTRTPPVDPRVRLDDAASARLRCGMSARCYFPDCGGFVPYGCMGCMREADDWPDGLHQAPEVPTSPPPEPPPVPHADRT
jgi:hypothetical protein